MIMEAKREIQGRPGTDAETVHEKIEMACYDGFEQSDRILLLWYNT